MPYIGTFKLQIFKGANLELTNEDLMELDAQRKDEERQKEEEETEELRDAGNGKGIFFI